MSDEDDRKVMIVGREADVPVIFRAPGSMLIVADCGCHCLISPSGQKFYEEQGDIETSCIPCSGKSVEDLRSHFTEHGNKVLAPGAAAEMAASPLLNALLKSTGLEDMDTP